MKSTQELVNEYLSKGGNIKLSRKTYYERKKKQQPKEEPNFSLGDLGWFEKDI